MRKYNIAVLMTCYNRKEKTLNCLNSFFSSLDDIHDSNFRIFLVDDGSTDGTAEMVSNEFPIVHLILGSGSLYWNQGMRLAWKKAKENFDFDFYLWLNDDTILDKIALKEILSTYWELIDNKYNDGIITAACRDHEKSNTFSYGGRNDYGPVIPNGQIQNCKYINGNVVLVPRSIFNVLGNLSNEYTHGIGDFDFGLRAINQGFSCYTTKTFLATCPRNKGYSDWCNPSVPLNKRWQAFNSPSGLNIKEYLLFRRRFWKHSWPLFLLKAYIKMLIPVFYFRIIKS